MRTLGWILLFCMAWPIFVLVWWVKPDSRPRFVQQVIDFVQRYPKQSAAAGIAFGLVGGIGNLADGQLDSGLFGVGLAAGLTGVLVWLIHKDRAAAAAEVAARAEAQHQAYLQGDDWGTYGTRDLPRF
ncbi:hypothetical protein [Nocardia gipuzkoensis]|uniref:hypothetical protein n=1 Tax=Nocardia gipuzkoensis TaxID=2749991 RepID=UPI0015EE8535|nr:hypothetical protein [Nocardia gipuzkoensis]